MKRELKAKSKSVAADAGRRTRRGRVLIVSPAGIGEARVLADRLGPRAVLAHNAFSAVCEIASAKAREPIELVVLAESAVRSVSEQPASALRRIEPDVHIVLVRDGDDLPVDAGGTLAADEYDKVVHDWPAAEELMDLLLGRTETQGDAAPDQQAPPPIRARFSDGASNSVPEVCRVESGHSQPGEVAAGSELGDVDLVEAVMHSAQGKGRLRELALRLMRRHIGFSDVTLVERVDGVDGSPVPCGETPRADAGESEGVPVKHGERVFGALRSSEAPAAELSRWAQWLAPWLALDEQHRLYRELSQRDELTGAFNRRYFMSFLADSIKHAAKKRLPVSVMVFDLDDFKRYNDEFGHAAGDEILRETVRLLNSVIRKSDRVCRIGGDEFAVVFTDPGGPRERGSAPPETAEQLAQRFQDQVCRMAFPKLGIEAPGTLSVSAGLATFPWDGWDPEALLNHADALALKSKRKGKNVLTLGRGAEKRKD